MTSFGTVDPRGSETHRPNDRRYLVAAGPLPAPRDFLSTYG
jgi:hypothetical protein